jgi:hypothetical protein
MEEGCAYLIGIVVVIGLLIAFIVYVVLPATGLLLGLSAVLLIVIAGVGVISGACVATYNFFSLLIESHKTLL